MIKISKIKRNLNNPREIKDEKFELLKKSIQDFPEMMALRPMIVDADGVVSVGKQKGLCYNQGMKSTGFETQTQHLNLACIYVISSLIDSRVYVGSTINFSRRIAEHRRHLKYGNHHSRPLQNFYNKYGCDSLEVNVLQVFLSPTKDELIKAEQVFLDELRPAFNVNVKADSCLGVKRSDATKEKIRQARTGTKYSDEYKLKMSKRLSGKQNPMFGTKGLLSPNFGKKHKAETRKKMKQNHADFSGANNPNFGRNQNPEATIKANATKRKRFIEKNGIIQIFKSGVKFGEGVTTYECANLIGVNASVIQRALKQNRPTRTGFTFQ